VCRDFILSVAVKSSDVYNATSTTFYGSIVHCLVTVITNIQIRSVIGVGEKRSVNKKKAKKRRNKRKKVFIFDTSNLLK
jgi:hypothetical protein